MTGQSINPQNAKVPAASPPDAPPASRRGGFFRSYFWLILRNVLGWILILAALVGGALIPGPVGLPLFLVGFALISFPGKRRLTARALRGTAVRFPEFPFTLVCIGMTLLMPTLVMLFVRNRPHWFASLRADTLAAGPIAMAALYLTIATIVWTLIRLTPQALNLLFRNMAKARRKFRPWLRRHRIHLLPPRWRPRRFRERGRGPFLLTDEILTFGKKGNQRT